MPATIPDPRTIWNARGALTGGRWLMRQAVVTRVDWVPTAYAGVQAKEQRIAQLGELAFHLQSLSLVATLLEVAEQTGSESLTSLLSKPVEGMAALRTRAGVDLEEYAQHAASKGLRTGAAAAVGVDLAQMSQQVKGVLRAVVAALPIQDLRNQAVHLGRPEIAHRMSLAFEAMRAYERRHDPALQGQLAAAGQMYAEGRVSLKDVARLVGVSVEDLLVEFERHNYCRSVESIRLDKERRTQFVRSLREARLSGAFTEADAEDSVRSSVVASMRIEGVDVRGWMSEPTSSI